MSKYLHAHSGSRGEKMCLLNQGTGFPLLLHQNSLNPHLVERVLNSVAIPMGLLGKCTYLSNNAPMLLVDCCWVKGRVGAQLLRY